VNALLGSLRRLLFGISAEETKFARRGFRGGEGSARAHLEQVGPAFAHGYHAALRDDDFAVLVPKLNELPPEWRGFAFEGAAMGLALLDALTLWRGRRVQNFLRGSGDAHAYMVHVGVGWVLARWPGNPERVLNRMEPLLRWLALDGYGFHEGFFHWPRYIDGQPAPRRLQGYSRRAFDQGFGRSLWFVDGADVELVPRSIARFPVERQADLWSGAGLAATYAGGVGAAALQALREAAGDYRSQLAQGAAFAAKARQRAGNITGHTEMAAEVLCGLSAPQAAQVTDEALENLPANATEPAYEIWRCRIQRTFKHRHEMQR